MSTYDDILFRLISLTKEIMNVNTTMKNLDAKIVTLKSGKGDVDALKESMVELQSAKAMTDETLTSLDKRATALEGARERSRR